MLISSKNYFERLSNLQSDNQDKYLQEFISTNKVNTDALVEMHSADKIPIIEFYNLLNKKLHKIVREVVSNKPRPISECVKTATSVITQATITLEKQFTPTDLKGSNEFIACVGLESITESLYRYFSTGNSDMLQSEISRIKDDILFVQDNFSNK